MNHNDAVERTQMLARMCRLPGLLASVWGSHGLASEGMVFPRAELDLRRKSPEAERYASTHLHGLFARAEPFYVAGGLVDLVENSYRTVPDEARLRAELFPAAHGCLFFERPVLGMPPRVLHAPADRPDLPPTEPAPMSGFAWEAHGEWCSLIYLYSWAVDPASPDYLHGVYVGNVPLSITPWTFGSDTVGAFERAADERIKDDDRRNAQRFALSTRVAVATLLLMDQTLTHTTRTPLDRPARKRALKAGWQHQPEVQVVTLRRVRAAGPEHGREVGWSCRWVVRQHWRTLHRGTVDERTVLVPSYIKGPEDKPLKAPAPRVWAVVR